MGATKLHHYVPQFYLRRFADEDGKFWVWDKMRDKVFRTNPKRVGAGSNFYRLYDFAKLGRDPLTLEKQFADLEGQVSLITDQWLYWLRHAKHGDRIGIPNVNRRIVSLYVALQLCRTADARDIIVAIDGLPSNPDITEEMNEVGKWGTYLWGTWLVDMLMKNGEKSNRNAKSYGRLSDRDETEIHTRWLWNLEMVHSIAERIEKSIWIFGRNLTGFPFITSDNPVAFHEGNTHRWVKLGFLARGAYLVFPLSPEIMMYCYDSKDLKWRVLRKFGDTLSPVEFNVPLVEHDNAGQVFNAGRFVISPINDFKFAREFAQTIWTDRYAPH
jgi:hypothetical protein